jgi:hypothetical protein
MPNNVDIHQITRSIVKSIPYAGAGIDELIFGTLDKKSNLKQNFDIIEALKAIRDAASKNYKINESIDRKVKQILNNFDISLEFYNKIDKILNECRNQIEAYINEIISDSPDCDEKIYYIQPRCITRQS